MGHVRLVRRDDVKITALARREMESESLARFERLVARSPHQRLALIRADLHVVIHQLDALRPGHTTLVERRAAGEQRERQGCDGDEPYPVRRLGSILFALVAARP